MSQVQISYIIILSAEKRQIKQATTNQLIIQLGRLLITNFRTARRQQSCCHFIFGCNFALQICQLFKNSSKSYLCISLLIWLDHYIWPLPKTRINYVLYCFYSTKVILFMVSNPDNKSTSTFYKSI
jgi:hypothetical protein